MEIFKNVLCNERRANYHVKKHIYSGRTRNTNILLFCLVAEPKERTETIEQLREALVHIIHSKWEKISKETIPIYTGYRRYQKK